MPTKGTIRISAQYQRVVDSQAAAGGINQGENVANNRNLTLHTNMRPVVDSHWVQSLNLSGPGSAIFFFSLFIRIFIMKTIRMGQEGISPDGDQGRHRPAAR